MFIVINDVPYNAYDISSFNKRDDILQNSDETEVRIYNIIYQLNNGITLVEEYDSKNDRDSKYNNLISKLVIDINSNES